MNSHRGIESPLNGRGVIITTAGPWIPLLPVTMVTPSGNPSGVCAPPVPSQCNLLQEIGERVLSFPKYIFFPVGISQVKYRGPKRRYAKLICSSPSGSSLRAIQHWWKVDLTARHQQRESSTAAGLGTGFCPLPLQTSLSLQFPTFSSSPFFQVP